MRWPRCDLTVAGGAVLAPEVSERPQAPVREAPEPEAMVATTTATNIPVATTAKTLIRISPPCHECCNDRGHKGHKEMAAPSKVHLPAAAEMRLCLSWSERFNPPDTPMTRGPIGDRGPRSLEGQVVMSRDGERAVPSLPSGDLREPFAFYEALGSTTGEHHQRSGTISSAAAT